ncbi:helix-turn-helix domain-containing protein [Ornithinibacillus halophilus]|uniref:Transcriptional regulator, XRE family with cupin sensor n=1 Tax=Ornithinibacillus halophilus TaxID=930117 RepID=A0A1M5KBX1_9BACI|nr:XRE family transcriptional regulator [Ornithinibacillus halophilus]SHG50275.1 transcriptional regulator, XRE family with cupin sensor [Ornithinibacillus halophilus]
MGRERIPIDLRHIGAKIKQARLKSKKTQQQIADQCGISKSLLSKIENGQTASAVATLSKISDALEIPLSWVLDDHPESDLVLQPKAKRQFQVDDDNMGYSYELLAKARFSNVEPTIVHVTPKDMNDRQEPYTHSQDEFIYIIEGSIYLYYDEQKHLMEKGDTAYFKGKNPHLFIPIDNDGAKVLTIFVDRQD